MTQHQKELVKSSFEKILPISEEMVELFYSRLFEIAPYVRPLFKDDMKEQGKLFFQTFTVAINSLDRLELFTAIFKKIGRDHSSYGVTNAHYDIFACALFWTLKIGLGAVYTDEVHNAWVSMYSIVADAMKKGAEEIHLTV